MQIDKLFSSRIRAAGALLFVSALIFGGCTRKAMVLQSSREYLGSGTYRAKLASPEGGVTGMSLQLNGNGRFTLATLKGGCFISEERGIWKSSQDELELKVQKTLRRAECGSTWAVTEVDTTFHSMVRSASTRGFSMLHDEILQGTEWTAWTRDDSQNFAMLEKTAGGEREAKLTLNSDSRD